MLPVSCRRQPAAMLIRRFERELTANVYRWTGHFPEYTRALLRHLASVPNTSSRSILNPSKPLRSSP